MDHATNIVKASAEVVGKDVMNNANEDLGCIKEVMLDKQTGRTAYVVMESGTILGMGGKFFAIPWNALNYDTTKECFKINMAKDEIKKAPGFDKDHWPDMSDRTFGTQIATYYHTKPYWEN